MPRNITYQTEAIADFYSAHRRRWQDFYPSERHVFETLATRGASFAKMLDVGCAAGGLGDALFERFGAIESYTGVEINAPAAEAGTSLAAGAKFSKDFITADICSCPKLNGRVFDLVTALSVADWNVDAEGIVDQCWKHVAPGGHLVISLRLTPKATICDIERSFQFIWFEPGAPPADAERAPYNVFNLYDAIGWLTNRSPAPEHMYLYGTWGTPSMTARTVYDRLVFAVVALRKSLIGRPSPETEIEAHLPAGAFRGPSETERQNTAIGSTIAHPQLRRP